MGAGYRMQAKANAEADMFIYEDIGSGIFGGVSAKEVATDLKALGSVGTINLHINSPGGDVFDGMAIYRLLVDHPANIIAHVDGVAASIASVIAMAGKEIHISEGGFIMVHDASGIVIGRSVEMREMATLLDTVTGAIADVYAARTGNAAATIRKWMTDETWFTAAEAVETKFATDIVANMRVAAKYDPTRHRFRHAPAALAGRPAYDAAANRLAAQKARLAQRRITENRAA